MGFQVPTTSNLVSFVLLAILLWALLGLVQSLFLVVRSNVLFNVAFGDGSHDHAEDESEPVDVEALECAEQEEPKGGDGDGEIRSVAIAVGKVALSDGVCNSGREVLVDGVENANGEDNES